MKPIYDITHCTGNKCIIKDYCKRYYPTPINYKPGVMFFKKPPFKISKGMFVCEKYSGDMAHYLLEQIKGIIKNTRL